MARYLLRRLIQMIPLLIGISLVSFLIMHAAPGGPLSGLKENPKITAADIKRMEALYGLNKPVWEQYYRWMSGVITGDWGISYKTGLPVWTAILERLPNTLRLMSASFVLSLVIAIPVGVASAIKRYTAFDYAVTVGTFAGLALPSFWFGMMLQLLFSVKLGWLPSAGIGTIGGGGGAFDSLRYILMPTLVLGLLSIAGWSRYMRASMLDTIFQDYVRTARAKGLSARTVITKHALKNAMIPIVTIMGLDLPALFGGATITERIFAWPGMGRLYFDAISTRDYPILMGVLMFTAVLVLLGNLVADVLYAYLDPRIKYD